MICISYVYFMLKERKLIILIKSVIIKIIRQITNFSKILNKEKLMKNIIVDLKVTEEKVVA